MTRTQIQKDADRVDMEMHRLAHDMRAFADQSKSGPVRDAANALLRARSHVRQFMHESDREATKWG